MQSSLNFPHYISNAPRLPLLMPLRENTNSFRQRHTSGPSRSSSQSPGSSPVYSDFSHRNGGARRPTRPSAPSGSSLDEETPTQTQTQTQTPTQMLSQFGHDLDALQSFINLKRTMDQCHGKTDSSNSTNSPGAPSKRQYVSLARSSE